MHSLRPFRLIAGNYNVTELYRIAYKKHNKFNFSSPANNSRGITYEQHVPRTYTSSYIPKEEEKKKKK